MNQNRSLRRRVVAPMASLALMFAVACGGDDDGDDGGAVPDTPDAAPSEASDDEATSESGDGADESPDDGAGDGAGDADGSGAAPSGPAVALADELHPIELPEPGTAVVTLAGETYVFEDIQQCGITDAGGGRWSFNAAASGELADGSATFFNVLRTVVDPDVLSPSEWHERDFVQISVEQEAGSGMSSNAWHDVHRDAPGDPIEGDGDTLPIIFVVDDGGSVAATAIAELSHPPFTGEFDRAGEGLGEFAVNCG